MEGNTASSIAVASVVTLALGLVVKRALLGSNSCENVDDLTCLKPYPPVVQHLQDHLHQLSDDSLVKIVRQLQFWIQPQNKLSPTELLALTERLVHAATWRVRNTATTKKIPTVRFGKTELQMPIITCGSMRWQHTWMPDSLPISISAANVVQTPSQDNLVTILRQCFQWGIVHFETARLYGSSEAQLSAALQRLLENGEIQRSDFILQTKLRVSSNDPKEFTKAFEQSWHHFHKLGHVDLLSFWCIGKDDQADWILDESTGILAQARAWQKQGRIKHIGFSTHGDAALIRRMIDSEQFSYVNLHYHYFGSYHAEGTPDGQGGDGHGNWSNVQRALELDMGVFNISPVDKGGRLYQPSSQIARTLGPTLTPISFAALHSWMTAGMHTISVGFARPEDLDEILEAAEWYRLAKEQKTQQVLSAAQDRLDQLAIQQVGSDWAKKGLQKVPSFVEPATKLSAVGYMLWCSHMLRAFGMYDTARARYKGLANKWNSKKTFEENLKAMSNGNPGRGYDKTVDYQRILEEAGHFDPVGAVERIQECHNLFHSKSTVLSQEERWTKGWDEAYDLRPWHEFPDAERLSPLTVALQNLSRGWLGAGGGPTQESKSLAQNYRECIRNGF